MKNQYRKKTAGPFWCLFVVSNLLLFSTGCGAKPDTISDKKTEAENNAFTVSDDNVSDVNVDETEDEQASLPPMGPIRKVETVKTVVDVSEFFAAALKGNLETVQLALDSGMDVNTVDEQKRTALLLAAFNGHTPVVKLLKDNGASMDQRDAAGRTALMFACTGDNAETVEYLLDAGAKVNAIDTVEQFTPLMHAAAEGQTEVVKVLLKYKADPDLKDVDGDTALSFAAQKGHREVIRLLTQ